MKVPALQIIIMLHASFLLALEWPLPILKTLPIYRSLVLRVVMLTLQSFLSFFFYQVRFWSQQTLEIRIHVIHFLGHKRRYLRSHSSYRLFTRHDER